MSIDQTLGDTTPDQTAARPTIDPATLAEAAVAGAKQMSVADVLAAARLPEKRAKVCLRADLQARYDELVTELGTLVNERGEILEDAEQSLGEQAATSKAEAIAAEIESVRVQMAESMWLPLFRGISTDDLAVFNAKHSPKKDNDKAADAEYQARLIAECAIDPVMSLEEVVALRGKLHVASYGSLVRTANAVCAGKIDVPFSLGYSVVPTQK